MEASKEYFHDGLCLQPMCVLKYFNYWPLKCTQRGWLGFQFQFKFFLVSENVLLVVFGNKYKPVRIPHSSSHVTRVLSLQKASTLVKLKVQIIGRLTQDPHTTTGTGLTNIALWLVFDALGHPDQSLFRQPTTPPQQPPPCHLCLLSLPTVYLLVKPYSSCVVLVNVSQYWTLLDLISCFRRKECWYV